MLGQTTTRNVLFRHSRDVVRTLRVNDAYMRQWTVPLARLTDCLLFNVKLSSELITDYLLTRPLETNLNEIKIEIEIFFCQTIHLTRSSVCLQHCLKCWLCFKIGRQRQLPDFFVVGIKRHSCETVVLVDILFIALLHMKINMYFLYSLQREMVQWKSFITEVFIYY